MVYAIVLAFIAIEVWQSFDKAEDTVDREANLVGDICAREGLPEATRAKVRNALRKYAETVVKEEWPLQRRGASAGQAQPALDEVGDTLLGFEPATMRDQVVFMEALGS